MGEPFVIHIGDPARGAPSERAFATSPIRMGRGPENDLVLSDPAVSTRHALLEFAGGEARITDLGSTNGTAVNGAPLAPHVPFDLRPGSAVELGDLRLTFPGLRRSATQVLPRRRAPGPRLPATVAVPREPALAEAAARPASPPPPSAATAEPAPPRAADAAPGREPNTEAPRPGALTDLMLKLAGADDHHPDDDPWQGAFFPGAVVGGRFELLREIGRGGFGTVFEARDRQLGRRVAFKAVRPGRRSQVQLRRDWLKREAEAVAQLSHPSIVSLHDVGSSEAGPYLIFELLRGEDLHARLRRGRVRVGEALELAVAVASALAHAHAAGVVHRDVKPSNVFLCEGGAVKVLDFGLSQVLGGTDTRGLGTPAYMAPEQWREAVQDARTDVFGAAVVLYETLTGRLPYRVDGEASAVLAPGARPAESSLIPRELRGLVAAALSPDPAARPRDGQAWLEGLREVRARVGGGRGAPRRGVAAVGARWWVAAAGAALALGAVVRWILVR